MSQRRFTNGNSTCKDIQDLWPFKKCKLKPQWNMTAHLSERQNMKIMTTPDAGEGAETLQLWMWSNIAILEKSWAVSFQKLHMQLPFNSGIAVLGIRPTEMKTSVHTEAQTRVFRAAVFVIAKNWKQPRGPSSDDCFNQWQYVPVIEYYLAVKRRELFHGQPLDESPEKYAEWEKPIPKATPTLYGSIYIVCLKWPIMELENSEWLPGWAEERKREESECGHRGSLWWRKWSYLDGVNTNILPPGCDLQDVTTGGTWGKWYMGSLSIIAHNGAWIYNGLNSKWRIYQNHK